MIKKRTIKKEQIEYFGKCLQCGKEIKGSTESQVRFNLDIHIKAKHGDEDENNK